MLPIVKRKTLEIPHTLAAVAAAICLVIAFASDFNAREQTLGAQIDQAEQVELIARRADAAHEDSPARSDTQRRGSGDSAASSNLSSGLLNWFGLPLQGR